VLIVDAPRWRARQILPAYLGGLATMMALNILRIAALVEIGARYSAQFAVGTFHSNAGWVLVGLGCVAYLNALARFGIGRIEPEEPAPNTAPSP